MPTACLPCLTALVPLIELTRYFARPLKLRRAMNPVAAVNAQGTSDKPHNPLWRVWHYFFAHMSKSAVVALLVYHGWILTSFALVCRHMYEDKHHFDE